MSQVFSPIQTATLDWQHVDGVDIPVSTQFGDVYFSKANGLLETRHVFLNGNDLEIRLAQLDAYEYFVVGETGFGTGLNFLALWQLWQQVRPDNHSHLHFISVEKFPLSLADLKRALAVWTELKHLADQLIEVYPLPLGGCHRLSFPHERISIDLWLGDAAECFPIMRSLHPVNAWFLDGFAPACNPELWSEHIFKHIMRLSASGTSFASFSVAGVLKRALTTYGVSITRPKGFGHKREMLKAIWQDDAPAKIDKNIPQHLHIIGAGIAGLTCAWSAAQRGISITLYDQDAPLAGASGNPLAFLNPQLGEVSQAPVHLMTVCWQYALRFYADFAAFRKVQVKQIHEKNLDIFQDIANTYPDGILSFQKITENKAELTLNDAIGLSPHAFAEQVLQHPLIQFKQAQINKIERIDELWQLHTNTADEVISASHVICCNARQLNQLFPDTPLLKPTRGQVTWAKVKKPFTQEQLQQGFSYGGYAVPLDTEQLIFGASFVPRDDDCTIRFADHQHNYDLLAQHLPDLANQLEDQNLWQGRASIRAQSADYFPLLGQVQLNLPHLFCFVGLGSKGFLFAPLCSEMLISQIFQEVLPVPEYFVTKLRPQRFRRKPKI